jgi:hypothetical protein
MAGRGDGHDARVDVRSLGLTTQARLETGELVPACLAQGRLP